MTDENKKLKNDWYNLRHYIQKKIGKKPADLNSVLFLIGIQELGQGPREYTKEEKQDLMHIAVCKVLSYAGYYTLDGHDAEGWPHWSLTEPLPFANVLEQENLLRFFALEYFTKELDFDPNEDYLS